MLALSAFIIVLTSYQASTEVIPDPKFLSEVIILRKKKEIVAKVAVEIVDKKVKGLTRLLLLLPLRHAKEYLGYGAYGPAVCEASRAYKLFMKLSRTTSRRGRP